MKFRESFINSLDSVFLALVAVWSVTIGGALLHPQDRGERNGVVEIHSLAGSQWLDAGAASTT